MAILFQVNTFGPAPTAVREHLILDTEGVLVHQIPSPANPDRLGVIGTWSMKLDPAQLARARALTDAAAALAEETFQLPRGGLRRTLILHPAGAGLTFPLLADEPLPQQLIEFTAFIEGLQSGVQASPLAAVKLEAGIRDLAESSQLVFRFTNPGTETVEFLLDAPSFLLWNGGGEETVWRVGPRPVVGLVSGDGQLVDGLVVPAALAPGAHASIAFRLPGAGISDLPELEASVSGSVSLLIPGTPPPAFPETPFRLTAAL